MKKHLLFLSALVIISVTAFTQGTIQLIDGWAGIANGQTYDKWEDINTTIIDFEFDTILGKADNTSSVGITLIGGAHIKIKGNRIGQYANSNNFIRGILFDADTAVDLLTVCRIKISAIYRGQYGIDLEPHATYHVEGAVVDVNAILNQTVCCLRVGASGQSQLQVLWNHFIVGLDGGGETPKGLQCYDSRNTFLIHATNTNFTSSPVIEFFVDTLDNIIICGDDIGSIVDGGKNTVIGRTPILNQISRVKAYRATTNQTIATSSATVIQFNAEDYDNLAEYDSTTNYRFTPTKPGYYLIVSQITLNVGDGKILQLYLRKNTATLAKSAVTSGSADSISNTTSTIVYLNGSTDYADAVVWHNKGTDGLLELGAELSYFIAHKIS